MGTRHGQGGRGTSWQPGDAGRSWLKLRLVLPPLGVLSAVSRVSPRVLMNTLTRKV